MNVATLLNQQTTQLGNSRTKNSNEGQSVFGGLLESIGSKVNNSVISSQAQSSTREKLALTEEDTSIEALLAEYIAGDETDAQKLIQKLGIQDDVSESIKAIFSELRNLQDNNEINELLSDLEVKSDNEEMDQLLSIIMDYMAQIKNEKNKSEELLTQTVSLDRLFQSESVKEIETQEKLLAKLTNLWNNIEQTLSQATAAQTLNETSVKILKLLEQWTALEKAVPQETANLLTQKKDTTEGQLWSRLLQTYQKRADGQMQTKYQSNATVTTTDVSKWIKSAISSLSTESSKSNAASGLENLNTGQPISKLEQFVVHVKQSTTSDQKAMENKLMEEFQKVIKGSKFMSGPNGSNQLLLKLKPDHLGDISIKLTQLNGEMIVKITATTQAAKDALESNIQQLRHMFSPQQVVIEKQDAQSFQQAQEEWTGTFDEQMSESSQQNDSEEQENNDGDPEKESLNFEELLMNERV